MTTTTDKLLARAAEYEKRAAALRLAAAELTDEATTKKVPKMNGALQKAIALRASQREPPPPSRMEASRATRADTQRRLTLIRTYLAGHPWVGSREIWQALQEQGETLTQDNTQKLVAMLGAELQRRGERATTRYRLKALNKKTSKQSKARRASMAANSDKTATVVGLVRDAQGPITIKELAPLARAAGITSLTGMYNYVTQGYLRKAKKHGHRAYAFVAMPPAAAATSSSEAS